MEILMKQIQGHGVIIPGIGSDFEFAVADGIQPMRLWM